MAVRVPSDWPDDQRRFHDEVDAGGVVARQPVHIVWWTAATATRDGVETWLAAYPPDPPAEAKPLAVFPIGGVLVGDGESPATLLGEIGLSAVCGIELADGRIVWPTYNPVVRKWAPKPGTSALARPREQHERRDRSTWLGSVLLAAVGFASLTLCLAQRSGAPDDVAGVLSRVTLAVGIVVIPPIAVRWRLRKRP